MIIKDKKITLYIDSDATLAMSNCNFRIEGDQLLHLSNDQDLQETYHQLISFYCGFALRSVGGCPHTFVRGQRTQVCLTQSHLHTGRHPKQQQSLWKLLQGTAYLRPSFVTERLHSPFCACNLHTSTCSCVFTNFFVFSHILCIFDIIFIYIASKKLSQALSNKNITAVKTWDGDNTIQ